MRQDCFQPKPDVVSIIRGSHKQLEPFVQDISARMPVFGFPHLNYEEDREVDEYWSMISKTINSFQAVGDDRESLVTEMVRKHSLNDD